MIKRIFAAALVAGVVSGLLVSASQSVRLVPLLILAESYEEQGGHDKTAAPAGAHGHAPAERTALTVVANVVIGVGFALMLAAAMVVHGGAPTWRSGVLWGGAAFAAFSLAPAVGLPPDVPGTYRADLYDRQAWWLLTAMATSLGLALLAFAGKVPFKVLGVALVILPHFIGAPRPDEIGGDVPPELAMSFATNAMAVNALFWVLLGWLTAEMLRKLGERDDA